MYQGDKILSQKMMRGRTHTGIATWRPSGHALHAGCKRMANSLACLCLTYHPRSTYAQAFWRKESPSSPLQPARS